MKVRVMGKSKEIERLKGVLRAVGVTEIGSGKVVGNDNNQ